MSFGVTRASTARAPATRLSFPILRGLSAPHQCRSRQPAWPAGFPRRSRTWRWRRTGRSWSAGTRATGSQRPQTSASLALAQVSRPSPFRTDSLFFNNSLLVFAEQIVSSRRATGDDSMQLETIKVFCDLINLRSFSKAAEANELSQPTVSRLVHQLEGRLGVTLIDRSKRPLQPTAPGQAYYEGCKRLLEQYTEL